MEHIGTALFMKGEQIMKNLAKTALALGLAGVCMTPMTAFAEVTITSELNGTNYDITYPEVPERVVTLANFSTEMLLELGLSDKIVGYGYMDNEVPEQYAEEFAKLNCISEASNPSQEDLLAVEPDFLIGWYSTFSETNFPFDFCEENQIKPYIPRVEYAPATIEDVYEDLTNLGEIFQVTDRSDELVNDMKDRVAAVEEAVSGEEPVSVFIYDSGEDAPFTACAGLPTDMISIAGGENIFASTEKNWMSVDWENVIAAEPEYIIIMDYIASDPIDQKIEFLKNNEMLADIPAVKNDNIFVIGLTDVTGCYMSIDAIETMAQQFHPECF